MLRTAFAWLALWLTPLCGFSATYSLGGVFQFTIPEEFELLSIVGSFHKHRSSPQYYLYAHVEVAFGTACLPIRIGMYGYGDPEAAAARTEVRGSADLYTPNYGMADQPKLLLEAYRKVPRINRHGITYSRLVSYWGSGVSSDYIGFYFPVPPPLFSEVIIGVLNSWDAFAPTEELRVREEDFDAKLSRQSREVRTYYALLQGVVDSIRMPAAPGTPVIDARYAFRAYAAAEGYYLSTTKDLTLRVTPSRNAAPFGPVMHRPCRIIAYGSDVAIDGVRGRWARVVPLHGNQVGWVFSGHLRRATDQEMAEYFDGL